MQQLNYNSKQLKSPSNGKTCTLTPNRNNKHLKATPKTVYHDKNHIAKNP